MWWSIFQICDNISSKGGPFNQVISNTIINVQRNYGLLSPCCHDQSPVCWLLTSVRMSVSRSVVKSSCFVYTTFCLLWLVQRNVLLTLVKILVSLTKTILCTGCYHISGRLLSWASTSVSVSWLLFTGTILDQRDISTHTTVVVSLWCTLGAPTHSITSKPAPLSLQLYIIQTSTCVLPSK